MPFPGNAGDAMIAAATCQMLRRAGLRWRMIGRKTPAAAMRGRMVLFGGGGNLTPWYEDAAAALARASGVVRRGVLAPHSVLGREGLLAALGPEFTLIARERTSAAHLRAHAGRAGTLLMHDMALSLDVEELFARPLPPGALSGGGQVRHGAVAAKHPDPMAQRRVIGPQVLIPQMRWHVQHIMGRQTLQR